MNKGNFIHKVSEIKQLNNWWFHFICLQFHALTFALDLGGTTQIHVDIRMYVSRFIYGTLRPLMTSCMKVYKGHSLVQTSFTQPPNTLKCPLPLEVTRGLSVTSCAEDYKGHSLVQTSFTQPSNTPKCPLPLPVPM